MKFSLFSGRNESRRGSARRKPSFGALPGRGKRLGFESLEDRRLLAIDALGQAGVGLFIALDVNRDHHVTPVDALLIINELNAQRSARGRQCGSQLKYCRRFANGLGRYGRFVDRSAGRQSIGRQRRLHDYAVGRAAGDQPAQ